MLDGLRSAGVHGDVPEAQLCRGELQEGDPLAPGLGQDHVDLRPRDSHRDTRKTGPRPQVHDLRSALGEGGHSSERVQDVTLSEAFQVALGDHPQGGGSVAEEVLVAFQPSGLLDVQGHAQGCRLADQTLMFHVKHSLPGTQPLTRSAAADDDATLGLLAA